MGGPQGREQDVSRSARGCHSGSGTQQWLKKTLGVEAATALLERTDTAAAMEDAICT